LKIDGNEDKSNLGANTILWQYQLAVAKERTIYRSAIIQVYCGVSANIYTNPMNKFFINGGKDSNNKVDIQEFHDYPTGS